MGEPIERPFMIAHIEAPPPRLISMVPVAGVEPATY